MRKPGPVGAPALATRGERGFALVIVLWTIVLITLVVTAMTASGRSEVREVAAQRSAAVARAAADGAMEEAIFHLAARQWDPASGPHRLQIGGTAVQVEVEDEAGKPALNGIPSEMMTALLQEVGVPPAQAAVLSAAMDNFTQGTVGPSAREAAATPYAAVGLPYGPSQQAFRSLGEVGLVLGMTPDILARLAPHVSAVKFGGVDMDKADPVVRHAFADAGPNGGYDPAALRHSDFTTVRVAVHSLPPAATVWRRATVLLRPTGVAYELMSRE